MKTPNSLLVIVDMQYCFTNQNGRLYVNKANLLVKQVNSYIKNNVFNFNFILFTQDTHFAKEYIESNEALEFPLHAVYGTKDWKLTVKNPQLPHCFTMYKNTFDMWHISKLNPSFLQNITNYNKINSVVSNYVVFNNINKFADFLHKKNICNIYIAGVATDYCVNYAAKGFLKQGFNVNILCNLTAGIYLNADSVFNNDFYKKYLKNNKLKLIK